VKLRWERHSCESMSEWLHAIHPMQIAASLLTFLQSKQSPVHPVYICLGQNHGIATTIYALLASYAWHIVLAM